MSIEVPAPSTTVDAVMEDGALIHIRRYGNPDGPRLALSHGNGLAIDGYFPFWGPLRERYDLILFDFRSHGRNPPHLIEHHNWPNFVSDLERIFQLSQEEFGAKRTVGVFHSLSAVSATMHTQRMGKRWDPLVLFDPPFYPRDGHPLRDAQVYGENNIADRAARRTQSYDEPDELARQFRKYFTRWVPEAYGLMARATLRRNPATRQWVLACPREFEAKVFRGNRDTSAWNGLGDMPVEVKLICADTAVDSGMPAQIGKAIAAEHPVRYESIFGTTHFLQIERPAECIRALEEFLAEHDVIA